MIHVIATITLQPERRAAFLEIFKANVPKVQAESGCVRYDPAIEVDSGIPAQTAVDADRVTVIEAWDSLEALHAHLDAPHMHAYRAQVKDMVAGVELRVLETA